MPVDLPGGKVAGGDSTVSTDYGTDSPSQAHAAISNVAMRSVNKPQAMMKATFGRKAEMWAFQDPLGQGSVMKQDDGMPTEIPKSDSGSAYAKDRY
jgi:hypothetical protein